MPTPPPDPQGEITRLGREVERLQRRTKIMAIFIGVLSGLIGGLVAHTLSRHLGASGLEATVYAGGSFIATSMFMLFIEEKLGLI
ncbi:hypothetical protein [Streptomyces sp. 13-12-16]|uniref:hypothetical protein n=1 Tax=Streptomyces sp. 13-12-16 TaxID=1570823 RepID=UPI00117F1AC5|nr:hypothetical protein [Streptomyces sp. 13-12-16]